MRQLFPGTEAPLLLAEPSAETPEERAGGLYFTSHSSYLLFGCAHEALDARWTNG